MLHAGLVAPALSDKHLPAPNRRTDVVFAEHKWIKTPTREVDLIKDRLKRLKEMLQ